MNAPLHLVLETDPDHWKETCEKVCRPTPACEGGWRVKAGNAGLDIPLGQNVTIPPGQKAFKIHLGVKVQPDHHYWLIPRSSMPKLKIRMANSVGLIDVSYRGELIFCVDNISMQPVVLKKGTRFCQIVSMTGSPIYFEFGKVNQTDRGSGGFGSTGTGAIVADKVQAI